MKDESDRLQPLVVPTRRGVEQLHRILETLARVELTDGLTLGQLLVEAQSRLPRPRTPGVWVVYFSLAALPREPLRHFWRALIEVAERPLSAGSAR